MKASNKLTPLLPWFICSLGALFYAYEYLLRMTPSVMTDDLMRFYHIDGAALGNLSAFYYYIYTPMQLVAGVLMDRYGPRRLLTIATVSCVIGTFLFANEYLWLAKIGRFLVGFGSAFAFVGVLKLATIWLPRRYFAMFAGLATALGMLGAILGDITLMHLVDTIGWRETVNISAAFGIVLACLIGLFVRDESLDRKKSLSTKPLNLFDISKGLFNIMKSPQMWIVGIIGGLLYMSASAFAELWGIPFLKTAYHLPDESAAIGISMVFLGWAVGGPLAGWISDNIRKRALPLTIGGILAAIISAIFVLYPELVGSFIYVLLFLFGAFTSVEVITFALGRELSSPLLVASALAFTNMAVMLSGVIFQPVIGIILDWQWDGTIANGVEVFSLNDYKVALIVLPISMILSALLSHFVLRETHCKPIHPDPEEVSGVVVSSNKI